MGWLYLYLSFRDAKIFDVNFAEDFGIFPWVHVDDLSIFSLRGGFNRSKKHLEVLAGWRDQQESIEIVVSQALRFVRELIFVDQGVIALGKDKRWIIEYALDRESVI